MVARLPDGRLVQRAGAIAVPVSSTESEIIALREALIVLGLPGDLEVRTDCKSLAAAVNGSGALDISLWTTVAAEIQRSGISVRAKWVRKRASRHMRLAHHLANAARVLGVLAGGGSFVFADIASPKAG